jgi:hypothetical protein
MVASVEQVSADQSTRQANCAECLTRDCPLSASANSPVTVCSSFREANCAFCATRECPLNGQVHSPVMQCSDFVLLGAAK